LPILPIKTQIMSIKYDGFLLELYTPEYTSPEQQVGTLW
jgi:hypothetical protein